MATRQIVGWSMADHLKAELCTSALVMAIQRWQPQKGLIAARQRRCPVSDRTGGRSGPSAGRA
jgi:hypothetical protein